MTPWLLGLLGCASPTAQDTGLCADAPVVTHANFGEGFLLENCQPCHASTTANRYGAPEDVYFDTLEAVLGHAERIVERSTGENADMPPSGGVSAEDRRRVQIWLTCWE